MQTAWMAHAACVGRDPDIFFPTPGQTPKRALAICRNCPVQRECYALALTLPRPYGVWAGMHFKPRHEGGRI